MKLLILSSLLALAVASESGRELAAATDQFHVDKLTTAKKENPAKAKFGVEALHQQGKNDAGKPYFIKFFKTCPQGHVKSQYNPNGKEPLTAPWADVTLETTVENPGPDDWKTTFDLEVLSTVVNDNAVWSTLTSGNNNIETGKAEFCLWFGLGDKNNQGYEEYYGFREIMFTVNYQFNGAWDPVSFETRAYDPTTGETTRKIQALAKLDCMPDMLYPGMVACVDICPTGDGGLKIKDVKELRMQEIAPGTSAPASEYVIWDAAMGASAQPDDYKYVTEGVSPDDATCRRVEWLCPARYFPQLAGETPAQSKFNLKGDSNYAKYVARRLDSGRGLQDGEDAGSAEIFDEMDITFAPAPESSGNALALGVAAAAAGAALLL